jgi:hypothetical protein
MLVLHDYSYWLDDDREELLLDLTSLTGKVMSFPLRP